MSPADSGRLPTDSGHLPADNDKSSMPLYATKGSLPALDCTPVAWEGVQINQGVLLPETCLAEARVSAPSFPPLCHSMLWNLCCPGSDAVAIGQL